MTLAFRYEYIRNVYACFILFYNKYHQFLSDLVYGAVYSLNSDLSNLEIICWSLDVAPIFTTLYIWKLYTYKLNFRPENNAILWERVSFCHVDLTKHIIMQIYILSDMVINPFRHDYICIAPPCGNAPGKRGRTSPIFVT